MARYILIAVLLLTSCLSKENKYRISDEVCFKLNGVKGTVTWFSRPFSFDPVQETYYCVVTVNNMNQIYEVGVYENQLQVCGDEK